MPAEVLARAHLPRGDRVLARAVTDDGTWLLGTRDALVMVKPDGAIRVAWERVETADWDRDKGRLRVAEVVEFGEVRPVHDFSVPDPGRLLQMVRERVSASVLLQRRVVVSGRRGLIGDRPQAAARPGGYHLGVRVRRGHGPRGPSGPAGRGGGPPGRPSRSSARGPHRSDPLI